MHAVHSVISSRNVDVRVGRGFTAAAALLGLAGIAGAGLLAATYFATDTWFDVARVDSLFLALSVAGLYAVRRACRTRGASR
jgi:hypothetical protein